LYKGAPNITLGKKNEDRTSDGGTQKGNVLRACCWEKQNRYQRTLWKRIIIEQVSSSCGQPVFPDDRGGFLQNEGKTSPDYTASHLTSPQLQRPEHQSVASCRVSWCDCLWADLLGLE